MAAHDRTPTRKAPTRRQAPATGRETAVVLEQVQSQMQLVLEAVTSGFAGLRAEFEERFARLEARMDILESVVRQNSEDIRKNSEDIRKNSEDIRKNSEDIRKNSKDIQHLRTEVARLRHDFDHREELQRMAQLEGRVAALEARLGLAS